ncbi:hypothetical protein SAMN04487783_1397 [Agrococcus baldri]|uniref:Uncharacterized protein n=1 Tax=Agrococcus baldri TaxID=153730 RepID=A0AA94HMK7_9MICO|nr:hypothetical protein [Agrococcus baldri]SFS10361.1 hypothetical protein SAMN04487783_1397 [Agrococcus baldri]
MHPLIILGFCLMVACCVVSAVDIFRTIREGREPERRMRAFLLSAGLLVVGGILVLIGVVNS